MSASTKNLTEGEPWRLILFFTLPLIAGNIFQQLYGFVDTLIVGRILGVEALAAVGCTGPLLFLIMGFAMGTTSGLAIVTGQRFGAQDAKGVRQSAAACLLTTLIIAAVMTVFAFGLCHYFLLWMQTPQEIIDDAYAFISIIFGLLVVPFFLLMITNMVRALGDSRMPTVILAFALTCNIILEPLFIMVFDWGVHLIDQLLDMVDSKVVSVYANLHSVRTPEVDDYFKLVFRYENGITAQVEVGTFNLVQLPRWYACGDGGAIVINDWDCSGKIIHTRDTVMNWEPVVVQTKAGPTRTMAPRPADTLEELPLPKVETSWTSYYRNIIDTIDGKAELIVTIPSVRRVLRLIEACFESDEKGEGVKTDI